MSPCSASHGATVLRQNRPSGSPRRDLCIEGRRRRPLPFDDFDIHAGSAVSRRERLHLLPRPLEFSIRTSSEHWAGTPVAGNAMRNSTSISHNSASSPCATVMCGTTVGNLPSNGGYSGECVVHGILPAPCSSSGSGARYSATGKRRVPPCDTKARHGMGDATQRINHALVDVIRRHERIEHRHMGRHVASRGRIVAIAEREM